jgi:hypothetical protein
MVRMASAMVQKSALSSEGASNRAGDSIITLSNWVQK